MTMKFTTFSGKLPEHIVCQSDYFERILSIGNHIIQNPLRRFYNEFNEIKSFVFQSFQSVMNLKEENQISFESFPF